MAPKPATKSGEVKRGSAKIWYARPWWVDPAPEDVPAKPDGPAIEREGYAQDRGLSTAAGAPKGWRKLTPLQATFEKNQLAGGNKAYTAESRFIAGRQYEQVWLVAQNAGRDSMNQERISGGTNGGASLSEVQREAIKTLASIHSHLGQRDREIVMLVCGKGYWPSEAVREVCADYVHTVAARFREALDALIEAIAKAKRSKNIVRMVRD